MMLFLLFVSALSIAGSAAFFSILGLAKLFSGSYWSIIIMGTALEFSKLVLSSYLYQYWDKTRLILKSYLLIAIFSLVCITSMGVAGYLMSSYQVTTVQTQQNSVELSILQDRLEEYKREKESLERQISDVGGNYVTAKQRLIQTFKPKLDKLNEDIPVIETKILDLQTKKIEDNVKIGPIIAITEFIGISTEKSILVLIVLLVLVFDPLAIAATICFNNVLLDRKKNHNTDFKNTNQLDNSPKNKAVERLLQENN